MASLKERVTAAVERLRQRVGWINHLLRMLGYYGSVNGNGQAGAVTYYGFLSFFPILALAFFVVGVLARVYPGIQAQMTSEIEALLPGVLGNGHGQIPLSTVEDHSRVAGVVGLVGVLYSGLGWLSGMRQSLEVMFSVPRGEQPSFLFGKLRDLGALAVIGLVLVVSVSLSGAVNWFSGLILRWLGVDPGSVGPAVALVVVGHALAILASMLLLLTMFYLLVSESHPPRSAMVRGALLGAVGFELLKLAANVLLGHTRGQPAFQAFGVALILVVWINYFSRLVMYSAAWAYTDPRALERRTAEAVRAPGAALSESADRSTPDGGPLEDDERRRPGWGVAALAAAAGGAAAWMLRGAWQ
jgi:membrane protein